MSCFKRGSKAISQRRLQSFWCPNSHNCIHNLCVILNSSFWSAIYANGSNYAEIITCLIERLQMSSHVTVIATSHTINTSICVWYTRHCTLGLFNRCVKRKAMHWHFHNLIWTLGLTLRYLIPSTAQDLNKLLSPFWWISEGGSGFIPSPCGNPEG